MSLQTRIDGALVRTAAVQADELRNALIGSINVTQIVDDVLQTFTPDLTVSTSQARSWAEINVRLDLRQVGMVVEDIYAIGWVLGQDVALANYAAVRLNKVYSRDNLITATKTDWDAWKPGDRAAEMLVRQPNGLAKLIAKSRESTVGNMGKTTINRIGTLLADALGKGDTVTSLASALREGIKQIANDPARAFTIANTEMNRAMSQSCLNSYADFGVEQVEWLGLEACELCGANADQGPVPLGELFASGDDAPPAHPNCRCSIIAVVDENSLPPLEGETEGLNPTELAERVFDRAAVNLEEISNFMVGLQEKSKAKFWGFAYRQKEVKSITRKMMDDAVWDYEGDIFKASDNVADSLRYTFLYTEKQIAAKAQGIIDELRGAGWNARVKNYWKEGSFYKGINVALTSPNGQRVELQFHTQQSIDVKEPFSHDLFEKYRELDPNDPVAIGLYDQLIRLWDTVNQPPNIGNVK
jgi:hypothetical protein